MHDCGLLIDGPSPGAWNMAVDEWLLEQAEQGRSTLRFYAWKPATLSLGFFQRYEERADHPVSREIDVVRRASGGGAIVHDRELTYSFSTPIAGRNTAALRELYRRFHQTLIATLASHGVQVQRAADENPGRFAETSPLSGPKPSAKPPEPFLCFARRSADDLVAAGAKVVGSAQRRSRTALLQHGSILLSASPSAPELPGLRETTGVDLSPFDLAEAWRLRLADELALRFQPTAASDLPTSAVQSIVDRQYGADAWLHRR